MADARLDIDDALSDPYIDAPAESPTSRTRERLAWASALLLVGLTAAAMVGVGDALRVESLPRRLARS